MDTIRFHQLTSSPGDIFHLTRATIPGGSTIRQHIQDFIEILRVDGGEATHEVNGESVSIRTNHFYQIFKQQYRMSPRKYRIKNKSVTGMRGLET